MSPDALGELAARGAFPSLSPIAGGGPPRGDDEPLLERRISLHRLKRVLLERQLLDAPAPDNPS